MSESQTTNQSDADNSEEVWEIPNERRGLVREFADFIVYNKAWWMTPIVIVLGLMIGFIVFAESSPILPFIYTVF